MVASLLPFPKQKIFFMTRQIKIINRNIARSKKCRCRYDNPIDFDVLQVNITYNAKTSSYQIDSNHLSSDKDSIYFYPSTENGCLEIQWNKEIADYIHRV